MSVTWLHILVCFTCLTVPHPLKITLCLIYHLKCHRPWRALKERWQIGWRHQMWQMQWSWEIGGCCSRLSLSISLWSRGLQLSLPCVLIRLVLSPQTNLPSIGIQTICHPLCQQHYPPCNIHILHKKPGRYRHLRCSVRGNLVPLVIRPMLAPASNLCSLTSILLTLSIGLCFYNKSDEIENHLEANVEVFASCQRLSLCGQLMQLMHCLNQLPLTSDLYPSSLLWYFPSLRFFDLIL